MVLALAEDSGGNIWVGGYGIGVYCIHKQTGRVQKKEKRNAHPEKGMATDYVYAIYAEGDYIWFGGIEGEFTRYDIRTDTYTYYPIDCIGDIKPGKGDSLLIAGCSGLAVFDKIVGRHAVVSDFWRHLSALSCPLPDAVLIRRYLAGYRRGRPLYVLVRMGKRCMPIP